MNEISFRNQGLESSIWYSLKNEDREKNTKTLWEPCRRLSDKLFQFLTSSPSSADTSLSAGSSPPGSGELTSRSSSVVTSLVTVSFPLESGTPSGPGGPGNPINRILNSCLKNHNQKTER